MMRGAVMMLCLCLVMVGAQAQNAPAAGKLVVVEGVVPDEATKATLLAAMRELYGAGRVVDLVRVDSVVAPPNWGESVAKLAGSQLKQVSSGELDINGSSVRISGQVMNEVLRQQVVNHVLASLNSSYTVNTNGLRIGGSPQNLLDEALADRIIEFERGSAMLAPAGKAVLDELVDPMKQIGDTLVQIIGHTDNVGMRQANVALSQARAETVRAYFLQRGIPAESMSVLGVGPDEPLADNRTVEGRTRNRRIQFKVL